MKLRNKNLIRFLDIIFSLFGIICLSPIFITISLLLLLEKKGGILFKQIRVGQNETYFTIYKFRSMPKDDSFKGSIDLKKFSLLSREEKIKMRNSYKTTKPNDKRIAGLGKFIRKSSIDELPQLFNVLIGNMSLVGPRPDAPVQEVDYPIEVWKKRCKLKPGITGFSQVYGRSNLTTTQRINHDMMYLNKFNVLVYLKLIYLTTLNIFFNKSNQGV